MSITVIATWRAREGEEQRVAELLPTLVAAVRAEPGNLGFSALRAQGDPRAFVLVEEYADESAIRAHQATEHFRDLVVGTLVPLLEQREVALYQAV